MQLAITGRNASIDAVNTLLDGGTLEVRTGAAADIDSDPSGKVLAILDIGATAFESANSGSATANYIDDVKATAAGEAGHYVAKDYNGNPVRNGTAGTDMILNSATFGIDDNVSVHSWTYSQGIS